MRRIISVCVVLLSCLFALSGCHEFSEDNSAAASANTTEIKLKEGETGDLGGLKVTVLKSEFAASQLNINVRVENKTDKPFTLKSSNFTVSDDSKTEGLPTTCGGRGGFSGELAVGDQIESDICWFLVGGTPPLTVTFEPPGRGKALIALNAK